MTKNILAVADPVLYKAICECALNITNGNIPITNADKKKLETYKGVLRKLSCSNNTLLSKRKIIRQKGGSFLPILLATLLAGPVGKYLHSK